MPRSRPRPPRCSCSRPRRRWPARRTWRAWTRRWRNPRSRPTSCGSPGAGPGRARRRATPAAPSLLPTETIVRDTGNPLLPGEHPFYPLTLDPVPGYVWGLAPMRYLIGLQNWREKKMLSMDDRDEKQIAPPLVLLGFGNLVDNEKAKAFRKAGGTLAANNPGADVKPVIPPPIPDPLYMIDAIDRMWENMESLPTGAGARGLGPASAEDDLMAKALLSSGPT